MCLNFDLRHVEGRMLLLILAVVGSLGGSSFRAVAERACVALYVGPSTLIALRTPTAHHTVVLHHVKYISSYSSFEFLFVAVMKNNKDYNMGLK